MVLRVWQGAWERLYESFDRKPCAARNFNEHRASLGRRTSQACRDKEEASARPSRHQHGARYDRGRLSLQRRASLCWSERRAILHHLRREQAIRRLNAR